MLRDTCRAVLLLASLLTLTGFASAQFKYNVTSYPLPNRAVDVATGDFDRDGRPDFLVTGDESDRRLIFMRNIGEGKFSTRVLALIPGPWIVAGDLNRDRKLDVVTPTARPAADATALKPYLGNGDGTFHRGADITLGGGPAEALA